LDFMDALFPNWLMYHRLYDDFEMEWIEYTKNAENATSVRSSRENSPVMM
jgi:hypothetical protein